jgi:hypothetical protein
MQKFFGNNKETDSLITVADLFGYIIAFFILWLIILGYKTITKASSNVPNVSKIKTEIIDKASPKITEASNSTKENISTKKEELTEKTKVVANSAIEIIAGTREKASKILSKEGAEETILSVNSYIDSLIHSVADTEEIKRDEPINTKPSKKDSLSSF